MIMFLVTRALFQAADLGVALMIPATAARTGPADYGALASGILVTLIWVPYFIRSRRVQLTFTR